MYLTDMLSTMNAQDIHDLAERHGWTSKCASVASTGSTYLDLYRDAPDGSEGPGEGPMGQEGLRVRVSDHQSAHRREDLDYSPGGHTRATIGARLAKPPKDNGDASWAGW